MTRAGDSVRTRSVFAATLAASLALAAAPGIDGAPPRPYGAPDLQVRGGAATQDPTFLARTEAVRVDVLVTDGDRPVRGLQRGDFEVIDNGVPQTVDLVAFEDAPLNVVLALDMSRSVRGAKLVQLRAAARMVVGSLAERDKAALLGFASTVFSRVPLTAEPEPVIAGLAVPPETGDTALVDAAYGAMLLSESDSGRPLVVIFSDGVDTASFLSASAVLETARRSNAVVYAVTNVPRRDAFLDELCARSGGRLIDVREVADFRATFLGLLEEFRHRYLISYTPAGVDQPGWHDLQVRVKNRNVTVRARPGYFKGGQVLN
jgi:VWFA-related protein